MGNNKISYQKEIAFIGEDNMVMASIVIKFNPDDVGGDVFIDYLKHIITEIENINNNVEADGGGEYEDNECI